MSYEKMAVAVGRQISRSEMGRIFAGNDFPSRGQLHLILRLFGFGDDELAPWDEAWQRLAIQHHSARGNTAVAAPSGAVPPETAQLAPAVGNAEQVGESRRIAAAIIDDAVAEADRIVAVARKEADERGRAVVDEARATAEGIISRAVDEQAGLVRSAEERIVAAFGAAEERLRRVISDLNESVDTTTRSTDELRTLVEEVRTSVVEVRDELAGLKTDAAGTVAPGLYFDGQSVAPPVIGQWPPGDGAAAEPPWHRLEQQRGG